MLKYKNILVTGSAGFIGFHLCKKILETKEVKVVGIDNLNDYYSPKMKKKRNDILKGYKNYEFIELNICDYDSLYNALKNKSIDMVVHLAAQPGIRYSLKNPQLYVNSNVLGTLNIFEFVRKNKIKKVVFSSSSSVYGGNKKIPFSEGDRIDKPISLYAATKKACEQMAYTYHHLYGIEMVVLRLFTVYGEFGRPDMATFKFAKNILLGNEIKVYNRGNMKRDFTYVSDVVDGIILAMDKSFEFEIFNVGYSNPINLGYFIELIEKYLNIKAKKKLLPMQPGDVLETYADLTKSKKLLGYEPKIKIEKGLEIFCKWFLENKEWLLKL